MIMSEHWLREWVAHGLDCQTLAEQLTMAGLEVDALSPVAPPFRGVVVGEILSAEQHPNADKLRVCQVSIGDTTVPIVCGAPNARAGLKAPLATVGAVLPGDFTIKKAKLRGAESQGMLCAEAELGLSEESAGLMELPQDAPVGTCLRDYLGLDDYTLELGITPNRADCLSILGIARDVAVLNDLAPVQASLSPVAALTETVIPVTVPASKQCPRYLGRVIEGVDISRPTPLYMVERLRRAGLRAIDPVVDVTNYVMLELGQPLHAFDLAQIKGGIVVRESTGEDLTLLDGATITLQPGELVIADEERPLALAGIMGGEHSGVGPDTQAIFLECAFFAPETLAGRARAYGLHTDASHRFERGVDFALQEIALERATALLLDCVGGRAGPVITVEDAATIPRRAVITLRAERIARVLGFELPAAKVRSILTGLGFGVTDVTGGWHCVAPSWRFDMEQEVDLIEELARVYGYNNLPVSHIRGDLLALLASECESPLLSIKNRLAARGFFEAITYSFIAPELHQLFDADREPVALRNPISSELAVMRTSLLPGLLKALSHNVKRQQGRVRLFETGLRFIPGERLEQTPALAMAMTGRRSAENWTAQGDSVDFFDIKGEVEVLLGSSRGAALRFVPSVRDGLHPGQTADLYIDQECIGVLAKIHPNVAKALDLPKDTFVAELTQAAVLEAVLPVCDDISKFPAVRRDIAVVADNALPAADIAAVVSAAAGAKLIDLVIFDVYAGSGVAEGQKSLALGLTFQEPSRTLEEEDVASLMAQVVDSLKEKLNVTLRS